MNLAETTVDFILLGLIIAGSIGNLLAFIVCSRPKLKNTVFSTYFRFRILIDSLNMFNGLNLFIQNEFNIWIEQNSNELCRLILVIFYMPATSGWIDTCISADRFISIKYQNWFITRKKRWFQTAVCVGLIIKDFFVYFQLYFSLVEITYSNDTSSNQTVLVEKKCARINGDLLYWIDIINATILPAVMIFSLTLLVLKCLYDSKRNSGLHENQIDRKRQRKFAITVISINFIFFVTNFPQAIFFLSVKVTTESDMFILTILLIIYYINYASTFYTNIAVNSVFREEFWALFNGIPTVNTVRPKTKTTTR
jgi:hypothetical protein